MTTCDSCGGSGRCSGNHECFDCMGTGRIPEDSRGDKVHWEPEDGFTSYPSGTVPVPEYRPRVVRLMNQSGLVAGRTYTFEMNVNDLVLAYGGVPVEECDLHPDMVVARLDRAICITARKR